MSHTAQIGERARALLAQDLGIPAEDILIDAIEQVDWPDTSLGVPEPGYMYAQMITPGYRIRLRHGAALHEYHSDASGGNIRYAPGA